MATQTLDLTVIAVGASAGGIDALRLLLAALPEDLPAAVLVVVHIPSHSPSILDRVLAQRSRLPVKVAADGESVRRGMVYVASADRHLMLDGAIIRTTKGPKECRARPAVNVLFRSVAEACGTRAIGVILSGALDDGTAGAWLIKRRSGRVFVQDPTDAICDSMPLSALEHVAVDGVQSAAGLAPLLEEAVRLANMEAPVHASDPGLESRLAAGEKETPDAVFQLGAPSRFACPECRGVLAEIREGSIVRYRCHTGHGYSPMTLAADLNDDIDNSLWAAVRALEEKVLLLQADPATAVQAKSELERAKQRLEKLRQLLLSE